MRNAWFAGLVAASAFSSSASAAVQPQLYGKSLVITWKEARVQRDEGETNWKSVNASRKMLIYISSAGRAFSRQSVTTGWGSGSRDVGPGGQAAVSAEGNGSLLTMTIVGKTGGAHRITVTFDESFQRCTAQASRAKEVGKDSVRIKSVITGRSVDMKSVTTSGETCSVQNGNVFGE